MNQNSTKMSNSQSHDHQKPSSSNSYSFNTLFSDSFIIFSRNKHIYLLIFTIVALPLSFLHFHLSLSSHLLKSQIHHLEYLATRAPTRFEARQVWKESREIAFSLFQLKLLYFLPTYFLSLIAAISAISAAQSAYYRKPASVSTVVGSIKANWARPLVTSICIYVILMLYSAIVFVFSTIVGKSSVRLRFLIWVFSLGFEIYVMAVLGMGLVVSVLEKRFGLGAIRIGYRLMEGRRVTGWVLSGLLAVVMGGIGWRMEGLVVVVVVGMEEKRWEWAALIGVYAVVVVYGFVVSTVFHCECRKRHVVTGDEEDEEMQQNEEGRSLELICS